MLTYTTGHFEYAICHLSDGARKALTLQIHSQLRTFTMLSIKSKKKYCFIFLLLEVIYRRTLATCAPTLKVCTDIIREVPGAATWQPEFCVEIHQNMSLSCSNYK